MGRKRKNPDGLPSRVYLKHGAYHYVDKDGKWHRLGERWDRDAKEEWAKWSSGAAVEGTVQHMLARYMAHLAERLKAEKLSPRHYGDRQKDVEMLNKFFGSMPADKVTRRHIALYLERRTDKNGKPAPIRANREIDALSAAYNHAIGKMLLDTNPCDGVPRNEEHVRERDISNTERRLFAKRCCGDRLRAYLLLKYLTGLRMGDMLRLSRANENRRGLEVRIGKSRKRKVLEFRWTWALRTTVAFIHRLGDGVTKQVGQGDSDVRGARPGKVSSVGYFRSGPGHPLSASGLKSEWRRAMTKWKAMGGVPFWEHDIRAKTAGDSDSLTEAQERLGHDRPQTTSRHYMRGVKKVRPLR